MRCEYNAGLQVESTAGRVADATHYVARETAQALPEVGPFVLPTLDCLLVGLSMLVSACFFLDVCVCVYG